MPHCPAGRDRHPSEEGAGSRRPLFLSAPRWVSRPRTSDLLASSPCRDEPLVRVRVKQSLRLKTHVPSLPSELREDRVDMYQPRFRCWVATQHAAEVLPILAEWTLLGVARSHRHNVRTDLDSGGSHVRNLRRPQYCHVTCLAPNSPTANQKVTYNAPFARRVIEDLDLEAEAL